MRRKCCLILDFSSLTNYKMILHFILAKIRSVRDETCWLVFILCPTAIGGSGPLTVSSIYFVVTFHKCNELSSLIQRFFLNLKLDIFLDHVIKIDDIL